MEAIYSGSGKHSPALIYPCRRNEPRGAARPAKEVLRCSRQDMVTRQSSAEQSRNSKGLALKIPSAPETAAETHVSLRAQNGFDMNQMAAEYRAVRASVLHLWAESVDPEDTDYRDMVRFNEAIDHALTESVAFSSGRRSRTATRVDVDLRLVLAHLRVRLTSRVSDQQQASIEACR